VSPQLADIEISLAAGKNDIFFPPSSPNLHVKWIPLTSKFGVSVRRSREGPALSTVSFSTIISERSEVGRKPPDLTGARAKFDVQNLSFWYGDTQALFDVSLKVPEQSVVALIGPSGCGKSTFLRALNRMNDLIEGTRCRGHVLLDDDDIYARQMNLVDLRQRVGMVFQKSNPFPKSVFENVIYGPRVAGMKNRGRLDEIAERCLRRAALWEEIKDRLDDSAVNLSGGQQQRLCIARALATDPEVLLLDEPASALDPASTARIEDLIFELKRDYTIVIVTHNMQQAARVSDLTAFFYQGRLIEAGPTEQLYTRPQVKQTEDYITGRFG
jgi:phosphate transport system ATP-binding protein